MYTNIYGIDRDKLRSVAPAVFNTDRNPYRTSDKFLPIASINMVDALRKEGFVVTGVGQTRSKRPQYTGHVLRFRHIDFLGDFSEVIEIVMRNANDATRAYELWLGVFRLVCLNGLVWGDMRSHIKIAHRLSAVDDVINGTYSILGQSDGLLNSMAVMKSHVFSEEQQLQLAQHALTLRFPPSAFDAGKVWHTAQDINRSTRREDDGNQSWRVFQRIQQNILGGAIHTEQNGKVHTLRRITNIHLDTSINTGLFNAAERLVVNGSLVTAE